MGKKTWQLKKWPTFVLVLVLVVVVVVVAVAVAVAVGVVVVVWGDSVGISRHTSNI
jgi:hypothetical protein